MRKLSTGTLTLRMTQPWANMWFFLSWFIFYQNHSAIDHSATVLFNIKTLQGHNFLLISSHSVVWKVETRFHWKSVSSKFITASALLAVSANSNIMKSGLFDGLWPSKSRNRPITLLPLYFRWNWRTTNFEETIFDETEFQWNRTMTQKLKPTFIDMDRNKKGGTHCLKSMIL